MAREGHQRLVAIKVLHTAVWAFFVGCIFAIPIVAWLGYLAAATVLSGIVLVEVLVLASNAWRCPLTPIAAKYTEDRRDNFDIFLPEWLARYNKEIFGALYVLGLAVVLYRWLG